MIATYIFPLKILMLVSVLLHSLQIIQQSVNMQSSSLNNKKLLRNGNFFEKSRLFIKYGFMVSYMWSYLLLIPVRR